MSDFIIVNNDELYHHGILGQKWGVRRYQNKDGSLTERGKKRASRIAAKEEKKFEKIDKKYDKLLNKAGDQDYKKKYAEEWKEKAVKKQEDQNKWKQVRRDYKDDESIVNKIVKTYLLGPFSTYTYNSARAAGNGRLVSAGYVALGNVLGGPLGNAAISSMIANDYKQKNFK